MKKDKKYLPSKQQTEKFDLLFPMIHSDLKEIRELSKRKQDEPLNEYKVKTINKKLIEIKAILAEEPIIEFLELLDTETLPTNSDAVLVVTQYINGMDIFKSKYFNRDSDDKYVFGLIEKWQTND